MQASGLTLGTKAYPPASRRRVSAVVSSPASVGRRRKQPMPVEKAEVFKSLEGWLSERVLPLLKPVERCWQPSDFLPDPTRPTEEFFAQVKDLQDRTAEIPDEYLVVLVGNMITEDALPTYQTVANTHDMIRDKTGASQSPWAQLTRAWAAEENRHGDLLRSYLYLTGRVDMRMIEQTMQYLLRAGMDLGSKNNSYMFFAYASFQERGTFVTHGNTARKTKDFGDPALARICGTIAADEKRHEIAYTKIFEKLIEADPDGAVLAVAGMMRNRMVLPGSLMYDGHDPGLHDHFSAVLQRLGVYTIEDYADSLDHLIGRWRLEKLEGLSSEARDAQEFVCGLARKIRRLQERADECARKMAPNSVKFSWIFNREVIA